MGGYPTGKKSLKIPKGQSESVHRRRTDNTMAKRKTTNGQTTIHINLKIQLPPTYQTQSYQSCDRYDPAILIPSKHGLSHERNLNMTNRAS